MSLDVHNNRKVTLMRVAMLFFAVILVGKGYSQKISTKPKVVFSAQASMARSVNTIGKVSLYDVVGQSALIGEEKTGNVSVQQGFLNSYFYSFEKDNERETHFEENLGLTIYPNPFSSKISIQFVSLPSHDVRVSIYDVNRKMYFDETFLPEPTITIPLEDYKTGSYVVRIYSGERYFIQKIMKN